MSKKYKGEAMQKIIDFFKKQGHYILIGLCVILLTAVIILAVVAGSKPAQIVDKPLDENPSVEKPTDKDPVIEPPAKMSFIAPIENTTSTVDFEKVFKDSIGYGAHYGVDYVANVGTKVISSYTGKVVSVNKDNKVTGAIVVIAYDNGYTATYKGLNPTSVKLTKGTVVNQKDVIGTVGDFKNVCGMNQEKPRLHFEIVKTDSASAFDRLDPTQVVEIENK